MAFFIRHASTNTFYGQIRGKPPLNWPVDIEQARPYDSRISAQSAVVQLACTFAGDRPREMDFALDIISLQGVSQGTKVVRRAKYKEAYKKWETLRDAWVEEFTVVDVGVAAAKKLVKLSSEMRQTIIRKIAEDKLAKSPNAIGSMGSRILSIEDF